MFKHCTFASIKIQMPNTVKIKSNWVKRILTIGSVFLLVGGIMAWYIFTKKFADTASQKSEYNVESLGLIKEFQANDSLANSNYAKKIINVRGRVSETEAADTTINIKMIDTLTGAYIIFAFQNQHLREAKQLKVGDSVSIKGSCSGGAYSEILETEYISFIRCTVVK